MPDPTSPTSPQVWIALQLHTRCLFLTPKLQRLGDGYVCGETCLSQQLRAVCDASTCTELAVSASHCCFGENLLCSSWLVSAVSLFLVSVGEPREELEAGGADAAQDQGPHPGEGDEPERHLDRLAVPARCRHPAQKGTQISHIFLLLAIEYPARIFKKQPGHKSGGNSVFIPFLFRLVCEFSGFSGRCVLQCRYTLQFTYPYAYYLEKGPRKELVSSRLRCEKQGWQPRKFLHCSKCGGRFGRSDSRDTACNGTRTWCESHFLDIK